MSEENKEPLISELKCFEKDLCPICKRYHECVPYDKEYTKGHISLFEDSSMDELEARLLEENDSNAKAKIIQTIKSRIINSNNKHIEFTPPNNIHSKSDIIIITKAQYDDFIKHGVALEDEVEELREEVKELRAYKKKMMQHNNI